MLDENRLICYCNDLTIKDIVKVIKENNIGNFDELVEQTDHPMGDKCEACHDNGYENDGYSLAMVLGQVKQGRL
jgi:bacterioferritin-associated ferredoxin